MAHLPEALEGLGSSGRLPAISGTISAANSVMLKPGTNGRVAFGGTTLRRA